jgi:hypothetical protein
MRPQATSVWGLKLLPAPAPVPLLLSISGYTLIAQLRPEAPQASVFALCTSKVSKLRTALYKVIASDVSRVDAEGNEHAAPAAH